MDGNAQSSISKDVEIIGTIKSRGSVTIDGKLEGELVVQGDVNVGKSATIKGNINSNSVAVEGIINGNITAKDKIDLQSSARVSGDIRAKRLSVEDGVTFVGRSEVNPSGTPTAEAPASSGKTPESRPASESKGQQKAAAYAGK